MDEDGFPKVMPQLVPYAPKGMPQKASAKVHDRLGSRSTVCESIHTSQMQLYRPKNFKSKSVQQRLGKNFVNPAKKERNRIVIHALQSYTQSAARNLGASDDLQGKALLNAITKAIEREALPEFKYDMKIQREISQLQGKELYYTCPGGNFVSTDGPGVKGFIKVPSHTTEMTMNQRFA